MFRKIEEYITTFYDLEEVEQDVILNEIRISAAENKEACIEWFRNLPAGLKEEIQPLLYEALAKDILIWSDFFLEEAQSILTQAKNAKKPEEDFSRLMEFDYIEASSFAGRQQYIAMLLPWLEHPDGKVKHAALLSLENFLFPGDHLYLEAVKLLLKDPYWKIRYWASYVLIQVGIPPQEARLSFADRWRAKLFSPYWRW